MRGMEIKRRGLMLVLSSPSGAGKSTISHALLERNPDLTMSVSVTTRRMRPGEEDGVHYHFIDQGNFDDMVIANEFLEHATVFENSYGTPRQPVMDALGAGLDVLFDVDWQGTQQIRANALEDLVSVFILPPSVDELELRLRMRAQDPENVVQQRMAKAKSEISHWAEYEYIIVNDKIEESVAQVNAILAAERHKRCRQVGLTDVVRNLGVGQ